MLKPPKASMLLFRVVRFEQFFGELRGVLDETECNLFIDALSFGFPHSLGCPKLDSY